MNALRTTIATLVTSVLLSAPSMAHDLPGGRPHVHPSWFASVPSSAWAAASLLLMVSLLRRRPERRPQSA